jgi:uncharacterized protein with PQ loop repeat
MPSAAGTGLLSPPVDLLDLLPVAAAVFAVPQFVPQLAGVLRTGDTAGVSWSWAALTSISNAGWIAYFALSRLWTSLVPAISATVLAGVLAALLARRGRVPPRSVAVAAGWAAALALSWAIAGPAGIGTALTASFALQVAPSVWTAWRTRHPTGISRATWLLVLAELLCWALYGPHVADPRLTVLGCTGVAASLLMLARTRRRRTDPDAPPAAYPPPPAAGAGRG